MIHAGPATRPISWVIKRVDEDREDAQKSDHADDRKVHALAAKRERNVERNAELARAERVVKAQRDQRDEHERVARGGAEGVEVAEHDDAGFAAERALVEMLHRGIETGQRGEDQHDDRDRAERDDRDRRRAKAPADALEDRG